jgi:hypothetical protein
MNPLIEQLNPKERRGSKPRCHLLTHGTVDEVAARLTALAAPFATVSADDAWMPVGFEQVQEAELNKAPRLLNADLRAKLGAWWLPADRQTARTPNFDIASTCTVGGVPGLLLVEAKAHAQELRKEESGRVLEANASEDRIASHRNHRRGHCRGGHRLGAGDRGALPPFPRHALPDGQPLCLGLEADGTGHAGGAGVPWISERR